MPPGPESRLSAQRADLLSTPLITVGRRETAHYATSMILPIPSSTNYGSCLSVAFGIPWLLKSVIQEREQNFLTGVFPCGQQRLASKVHLVGLECYSKASFPWHVFSTVKFLVVFLPSPKMIDLRDLFCSAALFSSPSVHFQYSLCVWHLQGILYGWLTSGIFE